MVISEKGENMNRIERLRELKRLYSTHLAEDLQDGTVFDRFVLRAIDKIEAVVPSGIHDKEILIVLNGDPSRKDISGR